METEERKLAPSLSMTKGKTPPSPKNSKDKSPAAHPLRQVESQRSMASSASSIGPAPAERTKKGKFPTLMKDAFDSISDMMKNKEKSPQAVERKANMGGLAVGSELPAEMNVKTRSRKADKNEKDSEEEKAPSNVSAPKVFDIPLQQVVKNSSALWRNWRVPMVLIRCLEFLNYKRAHEEEGIYRLSGSTQQIKELRRLFEHTNGKVDLIQVDKENQIDMHAVAGLLKLWFRSLPHPILTPELQSLCGQIMDQQPGHRSAAITDLVRALPDENYSTLRVLSEHLRDIAKNETQNRMGINNLAIVFSMSLRMSAGIFTVLLDEFDTIFSERLPGAIPIYPKDDASGIIIPQSASEEHFSSLPDLDRSHDLSDTNGDRGLFSPDSLSRTAQRSRSKSDAEPYMGGRRAAARRTIYMDEDLIDSESINKPRPPLPASQPAEPPVRAAQSQTPLQSEPLVATPRRISADANFLDHWSVGSAYLSGTE